MLIAERVYPERKHLIQVPGTGAIRADIARVVPAYRGIERLRKKGDQIQWGGPRLCDDYRFNTPDTKAHFEIPHWPDRTLPAGKFFVSTRRGNQFNSMVWQDHDPLTGSNRDAVLMNGDDARRLGLRRGDPVVLRSDVGEFRGAVRIASIAPGNLTVHWPEANALIRTGHYDPSCGEPDYNAVCEVVPLGSRMTGAMASPAHHD